MKKILAVFLFSFLFLNTANAEVTQFVFVTSTQSIPVSTLSETITVQSQNSLGERENIEETFDFTFSSNSPTGEFLSTSGNPVSTTMSRGTANKNFLYRDVTAGTYIISITATGRNSLQSFTANQEIVVGGESVISNEEENNTEKDNQEEGNEVPINTSQSAHSSPAPLVNVDTKIDFTVSAGRDRLVSVGSPVLFEATVVKIQNISKQALTFEWTFGDGNKMLGESVTNVYKYPGDYVVVLNSSGSDKRAVSRINIKVVSPEIEIKKIPSGIEFFNKSSTEINLGEWYISSGVQKFIIPKDTIISKGKRIVFVDSLTRINNETFKVHNPTGEVYFENNISSNTATTTSNLDTLDLVKIEEEINKVKIALNKIIPEKSSPEVFVSKEYTTEIIPKKDIEEVVSEEVSTENLALVFEAEESNSFVKNILLIPVKGFNLIKRLFVEE